MIDGTVADIGTMLVLGGVAWLVTDKIFRKIISNQHKTHQMLDLTLLKIREATAEAIDASRTATAAAAAAISASIPHPHVPPPCGVGPEVNQSLEAMAQHLEALGATVERLQGAVELLSSSPPPPPSVAAPLPAAPPAEARLDPLFFEDAVPRPDLAGKRVLIYGLRDLDEVADLLRNSGARSVVAVDVAPHRLELARRRLVYQDKGAVELILLVDRHGVPVHDAAFDFVYCGGDLHAAFPMRAVLEEMRRLLAPSGTVRIVLENYDSILVHLYLPFVLRRVVESIPALIAANGNGAAREAVGASFRRGDFEELVSRYGFSACPVSTRISPTEMKALAYRAQALSEGDLDKEHREFLQTLTFDVLGRPLYRDQVAGHRVIMDLTLAKD